MRDALSVRFVRCASLRNACACMRLRAPRARRPLGLHVKDDLQVCDCFKRGIYMLGGGEDSVARFLMAAACSRAVWARISAPKPRAPWSFPCPRQTSANQIMKDFGVTILCATPSYALLIADTIAEMGMSMDTKLTGVILGAESAAKRRATRFAASRRAVLRRVWPFQMGPGVCHGVLRANGLHQFLAEIVNPAPSACARRRIRRELVITTLTRQCTPLIRYRTRDLTRFIPGECACGRTHKKIDHRGPHPTTCSLFAARNVFVANQAGRTASTKSPHYQIVLTTKGHARPNRAARGNRPDFPFDEVSCARRFEEGLAAALKSNLQIAVKD